MNITIKDLEKALIDVKRVCVCVYSNTVDDEEEMLYGDSNTSATSTKDDVGRSSAGPMPSESEGGSGKADPTHWCMIVRENGVMEV